MVASSKNTSACNVLGGFHVTDRFLSKYIKLYLLIVFINKSVTAYEGEESRISQAQ